MSDLIQEFPGNKYSEWVDWYLKKHPQSMKNATQKISLMVENLKDAMSKIDEELVEKWVRDLVLTKTFIGLRFQESILKKIAERKGEMYRLATPQEESKGIDGFIGKKPISIKPLTYHTKDMLPEEIEVPIVFYEKKKDGINIFFDF